VRRREPGFASRWAAALRDSAVRLAGRPNDWKEQGDGTFETIRRGTGGRLQIVARSPGGWSKTIEDRFIAVLTATGNFTAAARAVGMYAQGILDRRRRWPAFAQRVDDALADAEILLQFRLATMGNDVGHGIGCDGSSGDGSGGSGGGEQAEDSKTRAAVAEAQLRFDPHLALQYLKWREDRRSGGGKRGRPLVKRRSIAEITDDIVRKAEAIRTHRERDQEGGGDAGAAED
ncbi:MAG TPA: hypothetical protein VEW25_08765, partial [Allosphingosinicella sp.]|nr:hypothetical protein [Allosphingosinicella sp.]